MARKVKIDNAVLKRHQARQHAGNQNFATHNPCTMVYLLVEELIVMQKTAY